MQKLQKPVWLKHTAEQVKELIIELAKQGLTAEKIGLILRDVHGIPTARILGKRISHILKEANLYQNPDMTNVKKRIEKLKKHVSAHKHDNTGKRSLMAKEARINKFKRYSS